MPKIEFPTTGLILIPGFMSPAWMMRPLHRALRDRFATTVLFDYPRVFSNLSKTVGQLRDRIDAGPVDRWVLVTHSFGDWVARAALACRDHSESPKVIKAVSIAPVIDAVPMARRVRPLLGRFSQEIRIMSDRQAVQSDYPPNVQRIVLWTRWEWLMKAPPSDLHELKTINATHNSVLFQPAGIAAVRGAIQELCGTSTAVQGIAATV
ncbi:esterase/lipase family protein [Crateriforma conspicua]|uniref:esterase/lipase family protein n=1 Tax=Crateriforma conspicua TaxID=2527996 RepID=UPI001188B5D5|nr:alpha/beta hydrolase [Crateriforma conspicua]QDV62925.1 Alpha/beta hydrolase family protein [Crateriforma conspicua]